MLVKLKSIGYPFKYLMELHGVPPGDFKRIMEMREAEATDPMVMAAMQPLEVPSESEGGV